MTAIRAEAHAVFPAKRRERQCEVEILAKRLGEIEVMVLIDQKSVRPPLPPLIVPPSLWIVALPAVELSRKIVRPALAPLTETPRLLKVALLAVDVPKNPVVPPSAPLTVPAWLLNVALAAVELS